MRIKFFSVLLVFLVNLFLISNIFANGEKVLRENISLNIDDEKIAIPDDIYREASQLHGIALHQYLAVNVGRFFNLRDISVSAAKNEIGQELVRVKGFKILKISEVSLEGLPFLEDSSYKRVLRSQVGEAFLAQDLELDKLNLETKLHDKGYPSAKVVSTNSFIDGSGRIRVLFEIERGRPCRIAEVLVKPEQNVLDFITLPVELGSICDKSMVLDSLERERNRLKSEGYLNCIVSLDRFLYSADNESASVQLHIERGIRTRLEIVNLGTGAVNEDLLQGKNGLSPLELTYYSNDDIRNNIQVSFQKRGFVNAFVTGPVKLTQGNELVLRFTVQPGLQVSVAKVEIEGLMPLPQSEMAKKLGLGSGYFDGRKPFVESEIPNWQDALKGIYFDYGYADVQVERPTVILSPDGKLATLIFRVNAGPQFVVHDIIFAGKPSQVVFNEDILKSTMWLGDAVTQSRLKDFEDQIKIQMLDFGYAYAQVKARPKVVRLESGKNLTRIAVEIVSGHLVHVGNVFAEGELYGKRERVIKESGIETGEIFTPKVLDRARLRILKHDLFGNVAVEPLNPGALEKREEIIDIVIRTQSRGGYTLGLQPGFGSVKGYRFSVDFILNNLTPNGLRFNSSASLSQERQQKDFGESRQLLGRKITMGLLEPLLQIGQYTTPFDASILSGLEVSAQSLSNRLFETLEGTLSWKPYFFDKNWVFSTKFAHEWSSVLSRKIEPLEALDRPTLRIHEIDFGLSLDTRNNIEWPTSGFLFEFNTNHARLELFSEVQYDRFGADFAQYFPIFENISGAVSFGGMSLSNVVNRRTETVTAPGSRRASLSGRSVVRGFPESGASVGPLIWLDLQETSGGLFKGGCGERLRAIGATNLLYLKSEIRTKLPWLGENWGGALFADSGNSFFTDIESAKIQDKLDEKKNKDAGSQAECSVRSARLISNSEVAVKKASFIGFDYFKNAYISGGFGLRYIVPRLVSINADWGFPWYEPADKQSGCVSIADANRGQNSEGPTCVKRKASGNIFGLIPIPGTIHLGIGASF